MGRGQKPTGKATPVLTTPGKGKTMETAGRAVAAVSREQRGEEAEHGTVGRNALCATMMMDRCYRQVSNPWTMNIER